MKRRGGLWAQVVAFDNLRRAARRAALGKRRIAGVARFLADLEPEVLALQRELTEGTWRPGRPTTFRIHDPKERTITAAPFRDRVVHHALIDVREHGWFLKLDISKCFDSLDDEVVLGALGRVVKDSAVLDLATTIVRFGGRDGVGLPIGNLTSQWLANLVLDRLDHHVKELLRVRGYVRYMDDFVLFGATKGELRALHAELQAFVETRLVLRLKERATVLAPTSQGLPFLGWRIYRGTTRLRPGNLRRIRARLRHRAWEYRTGRISLDALVASRRSITEHLRHGSTLALRRRLFERDEPLAAPTGSTGVGRSTTTRGTRARPTATTTTRATAGTTSAFARTKAPLRPNVRVTSIATDPALCTRCPGSSLAPP